MSDFDFDELDKAVTGALGNDTPEEKPTSPEVSEAARETPAPAPEEKPAPAERPAAPAARRSSGRFMDVVHPSSDMRTKTSSFTPPSSPSAVTPDESVTPTDKSEVPATDTQEAWAQPLESPFLPDAKVEKRPLGAFATEISSTDTKDDEEELLLEAPDEPRIEAHTMPDPIDFAAHASALPSENEDTGSSQSEVLDEEVQEEPTPEATPAPEAPVEEAEAVPTPSPAEPEVQPEPAQPVVDEPVGPASITQQYTEQPSSAPSSGAIYDTETYHKPLAPTPKKRSGVWVAIWIFLLIVLGAGAGVAFYLFVLPLL